MMSCNRLSACLLSLALLLSASSAFALRTEKFARFSVSSGKTSYMDVVSGVASVRFAAGVSTAAAAAALARAGYEADWDNGIGGWYRVTFSTSVTVGKALGQLKAFSAVAETEPDRVYRINRIPSDPYIPSQYALTKLQAFNAWDYETGLTNRVTVAVIDTGIQASHPEFSGKFSDSFSQFCDPGLSKTSNDNPACATEAPVAACYHGTAVAGVAAAGGNNGLGIAGLSWGAKLVSMRVFRDEDCPDSCDSSTCETDDWAMANALNFLAARHGTASYGKIIANLSLGCPANICGGCSATIQAAVTNSVNAGMMIFAAAGNGADTDLDSPASCTGVYAVGATDAQDNLASFSTTDSTMAYRGLVAPGVGVYSTTLNGGYAAATGTSFASPMAAGLAALVWSAAPGYSAAQVFDVLKSSAADLGAPGPDASFGWGRINAYKSICQVVTCAPGAPDYAPSFPDKVTAFPNPFRPALSVLGFRMVGMSGVDPEIRIYTAEGEQVRKLDGLFWDGRNAAGAPAASGIYYFRVKTGSDSATGKFALIR